ncbi:uncharacterized protein ACR2FA_001742 [Aphomia sociella]
MTLQDLNLLHISKLISTFIDQVTCLECCKYYIAPETASCGHTFCHTCWKKTRTCPSCAAPLERHTLKPNIPVQNKTEHTHTLTEIFEKLFKVKLDEYVLDVQDQLTEDDPTKNVKDWLASSQNHFSAPLLSSENSTQDMISVEHLTSKVQVHADTKKIGTPKKIVHKQQPQDDWEKIEIIPATDENKSNNNIHEHIDELHLDDKSDYTTDNPRRSSRKREIKNNESITKNPNTSQDKHSSKNSSLETEKTSLKNKRNWGNVKKMRKEFSKLNKKNRNKLNVSIEMCKKSQVTTKSVNKPAITTSSASKNYEYHIEDNTPDIIYEKEKNEIESNMQDPISNIDKSFTNNDNEHSSNIVNMDNKSFTNNTSKVLEINKKHDHNNSKIKQSSEKSQVHLSVIDTKNGQPKMSFMKKSALNPRSDESNIQTNNYNIDCNTAEGNMDDIEITIKVGNTLTNIFIKKKKNCIEYNVNTDKEIQTSLGPHTLSNENNINVNNIEINIGNDKEVAVVSGNLPTNNSNNKSDYAAMNKSVSTKKHTASTDTRTAQFEITESVEKELSKIMECDPIDSCTENQYMNCNTISATKNIPNNETKNKQNNENIHNNENSNIKTTVEQCLDGDKDYLDDLDIFESNSIKEGNVLLLKNTKHLPSEILMPTMKSNKLRTQKHANKRDREVKDELYLPSNKKIKLTDNIIDDDKTQRKNEINSEPMNYDLIMDQVFSSIDADIKDTQKNKSKVKNIPSQKLGSNNIVKTQKNTGIISFAENREIDIESSRHEINMNNKEICDEKFSENVFSFIDKDIETNNLDKLENKNTSSTQQHIENLLTPGLCENLVSPNEIGDNEKELCTPLQVGNDDDSDKSIVEETPQKNVSFIKPKNKNEIMHDHVQMINKNKQKSIPESERQIIETIVDLSDSMPNSSKAAKDLTVIEALPRKTTLETPLTINRFVDHIKHKSTPVARKSLHFDNENNEDVDQTLCPTMEPIAKTTQEKEFLCKAFDESPQTQTRKPLTLRNMKLNETSNCLAGSCLNPSELAKLKLLCRQYNWKYSDKYTQDITHLVVGVDEENKSQRSVKYMCALAASKWIVSFEWVESCLKTNKIVKEEPYEALDGTGEPGPKRSRIAKKKLFEGIVFYCMPPFSVLDVNTLKDMLEAAGGQVVNEARAVRVTDDTPALLLAEPENTQENKFIYLAMELNIVPVNYEWVLNSLGSYTLGSILELLLCPVALLPQATARWPAHLVSQDCD